MFSLSCLLVVAMGKSSYIFVILHYFCDRSYASTLQYLLHPHVFLILLRVITVQVCRLG